LYDVASGACVSRGDLESNRNSHTKLLCNNLHLFSKKIVATSLCMVEDVADNALQSIVSNTARKYVDSMNTTPVSH
jgi:hypothetical protein